MKRRLPGILIVATLALAVRVPSSWADSQSFLQDTIQAFADSDIIFQRSVSNAPFIPIGFLGARHYGETRFTRDNGDTLTFEQSGASAMGIVPFLLSDRDALFTGAYLSNKRFRTDSAETGNFNISTIGVPLALFRQFNPRWQVAGFLMPFAHYSDQEQAEWSYQTMGGVFARYTQNERVWWAYGLFADYGVGDSYVLPYIGASVVLNARWTISAIMPWPSIIYAPTEDWLFSFGASPSGASWSIEDARSDVSINLDGWDLGLSAERRIHRKLWLSARAGVGGLRNLRLNPEDGSRGDTDIDVDSGGFFALSLRLRP